MVALFQEAYELYVRRHPTRGDRPCCFFRVGEERHNTSTMEEPSQLPRGRVLARQLFGIL
jgi:hypothetical protein